MGKAIFLTGGIGFVALMLGIAAVIMFVKNNKKPETEQAQKDNKKDEPPAPHNPSGPPDQPKGDSKKEKELPPKKNTDQKVPKDPPAPPAPEARPTLLPPKKTFSVGTLPAKPTLSDQRKYQPLVLDVPIANVRRVFPPLDPTTGETGVLVQVAAAAGDTTQRLALNSFPASGTVTRIEYEGDGLAVPIADLHASATGVFFLAAVGGKLNVWSVIENKKIADGISPYAGKPEHAKAGLAAAFFAPDPMQVFTVSTAGGVLLYDLRAKKAVSEFVPRDGAPGKVALGLSVAKADGNGSIVVAVSGVLYQVEAKTVLNVVREHDLLGGTVGRSIAAGRGRHTRSVAVRVRNGPG